jgi:hypothetical protein
VTWHGQQFWVGAATRDVDFAYLRPGNAMTHKIAEDVDQERDKVVNDLVFTSCVDMADDMERQDVPMFTRNATGDPMRTDTRISILQVNGCETPNGVVRADSALPVHGNKMQRFARREILSFRSDIMRENLYWRSYEGVRMMIDAYRQRGGRGEENKAVSEERQNGNRASFVTDMFR